MTRWRRLPRRCIIGAALDSVYKTLVVVRDAPGRTRLLLVMAPSHRHLDLHPLARSLGEKKLRMAAHHEAELVTSR